MKKKTLNLNELKVKSFVTAYESDSMLTLKGGGLGGNTAGPCQTDGNGLCPTANIACGRVY